MDLSSSDLFPSLSASKKAKRQENKAKKLHAYYELIKDKQPSSFENNKLPKPASKSEVSWMIMCLVCDCESLYLLLL